MSFLDLPGSPRIRSVPRLAMMTSRPKLMLTCLDPNFVSTTKSFSVSPSIFRLFLPAPVAVLVVGIIFNLCLSANLSEPALVSLPSSTNSTSFLWLKVTATFGEDDSLITFTSLFVSETGVVLDGSIETPGGFAGSCFLAFLSGISTGDFSFSIL